MNNLYLIYEINWTPPMKMFHVMKITFWFESCKTEIPEKLLKAGTRRIKKDFKL